MKVKKYNNSGYCTFTSSSHLILQQELKPFPPAPQDPGQLAAGLTPEAYLLFCRQIRSSNPSGKRNPVPDTSTRPDLTAVAGLDEVAKTQLPLA
jgi:hypothetical protein